MTPTATEHADADARTKDALVKACRVQGAPEEYIAHRLGMNRKPKQEEKQRVYDDLERIRSGETWDEVWTPETP